MSNWASECEQLIKDCEARESRLSEWDAQFLDSVRRQFEYGRMPTPRQAEKLDEIWKRATAKG